jgi:hypothetical protein
MGSISIHTPEERLVNLSRDRFTNAPVFAEPPTYWCASCDSTTRFKLGRKNPAPFTPTITEALDSASGPAIPWETDYTDFCCLTCGQPVRVTHAIHEFAMSSYRYLPLCVYTYSAGS